MGGAGFGAAVFDLGLVVFVDLGFFGVSDRDFGRVGGLDSFVLFDLGFFLVFFALVGV